MAFGIYVHIPYCLQICSYCDFTKYEWGKIMPPEQYVDLLKKEIRFRAEYVPMREVSTIYFGGGTPSLFEPRLILSVLDELGKAGFRLSKDIEITIEIDPATCDQEKLSGYLDIGVNRFSVGAQSFNDRILTMAGRKHSSLDTVETLSLLRRNNVNYSFDLLFALPGQTLEELRVDVATALMFDPAHLSAYCLTVPEGHRLSVGRAPDEEQVEMFHVIEDTLSQAGLHRYEISNFAKPGFESRHNILYWTDQPYWGIGLSSHSYLPSDETQWGLRFWNPRALKKFEQQLNGSESKRKHSKQTLHTVGSHSVRGFRSELPSDQVEILLKHQALTDYCHTSLRLSRGVSENALRLKFGISTAYDAIERFKDLTTQGLLHPSGDGWVLTRKGRLLANVAFERLTFLEDEMKSD